MNRTKNAIRNIIWGVVERAIAVLIPFVTRTLMIKVLGAEYLGLNSLFTSILQVLSISELGIGSAIVFSMYKPIAEDDKETLCALLNIYRKIYYCIGTIILILGLLALPFLPHLISGSYPENINIYILYLIFLFNTVVSYYLFSYKQALFTAHQRNDLVSKRIAGVTLCSSFLQMILLLAFRNFYVYVLVIPLATICTNIINAVLAKKVFPEIVCKGSITQEIREGIKKRIVGLVSFKIYNVVFASVDTIVISAFLGLTQLAIFNNYYYIQNSIVSFVVIFTTSITAGIGNKMVTNSVDENYENFKQITFMNSWICGWCAVCLFCLYQHFMKTWVGQDLTFPFLTMILMVLYFLVPRITNITYTYREAAGLWWEDRFRPIVATVVNLSLNLILVRFIGMNGVIISTLFCSLFINIPWGTKVLFKHYFKRSAIEYFLKIGTYMLVIIAVSILTMGCCSFLPVQGWGTLMCKLVICCIVPNLCFYFIYRKSKEFCFFKEFIIKKIRKVKGNVQ